MRKNFFKALILLIFGLGICQMNAQDRTVMFNVSDSGVSKPITWGLDLAWLSETNIRRGIAFMGVDRVDIIRSSFMLNEALVNGELQGDALTTTNQRINIINTWLGPNTQVMLNLSTPSINASFVDNAANFAELIKVTTRYHQDSGRTVIAVAPLNEPDYATWNGDIDDFYNICDELRNDTSFNNIRISGGNTLNCDVALQWYNFLRSSGINEGNTHQLAGSFNNYASFFQTVRANGDHATNDELHNVMEAMVGAEYGMQTGIWWGTAEYTRGEFVKASDGVRLGYAEYRTKWTAASVYRAPDGKVQAFVGGSERQAATTTYRFVSENIDVFFDGYGPQREFTIEYPGGAVGSYQNGQTNAERVINITWGEDVQPVIDGKYVLVNRNSGMVMEVADGSTANGANVQQNTYSGSANQQWNVKPVDPRIGGDFSYFKIAAANTGKVLDVNDWSLDNGGNVHVWDDGKGENQRWYLEYAGDGWFYIRSRYSAKSLEVSDSGTSAGVNIQQWDFNSGTNQQWRFLPVVATIEFDPPGAPTNLVASANAESIRLDWSASTEPDVASYSVFRSDSAGGPYNTIARNVPSTSFVDNTTTSGGPYFYTVKVVDSALNISSYSNEVSASATDSNNIVAHFYFEDNTIDSSVNLNHGTSHGKVSFVGNVGNRAMLLNGSDAFVQLPAYLANQQEITIATWVNWRLGSAQQHIFDFGNSQDECMYLTPEMRFVIKKGDIEQTLYAHRLNKDEWFHVAVTLDTPMVSIYVDGEVVSESDTLTLNPLDFKPLFNYIGRSQWSVSLFNGYIDDFRVYNYALSANEISQISQVQHAMDVENTFHISANDLIIWPLPANDVIYVNYTAAENSDILSKLKVFNTNGELVLSKEIENNRDSKLNVSNLPSGVYVLKLTNNEGTLVKKLIIQHY